MTHKIAVTFTGFVVVVAIVTAGVWVALRPASTPSVDDETAPRQQTFQEMLLVGDSAIYVDDQPSGATEVLVGFAVMRDTGFVVIYADDGGVPGRVIGVSAVLPPGGGEHTSIALDEALVGGEIYYAMLYRDDGDGAFDATKDRQVADADGNVILMTFAASEDAAPEGGPVIP